jgi:hypothetical protein
MISDYPLLDGSITTDRSGISFCFVAKALCRTCPCHYSHVSISEWSATRTKPRRSRRSSPLVIGWNGVVGNWGHLTRTGSRRGSSVIAIAAGSRSIIR